LKAILVGSLLVAAGATGAAAQDDGHLVIVAGLQPLYSIAASLTEGIDTIEVKAVPETLPSLAGLPHALGRLDDQTEAVLASADAVVTAGSVWPEDPLFRVARNSNIRVVDIDAATSLTTGKAVPTIPSSGGSLSSMATGINPYAWFAPTNAIDMAQIVAEDLSRLAPADAEKIKANLDRYESDMQAVLSGYGQKFLSVEPQGVFSLTDKFSYLLNDVGIYVDRYFLKPEVEWTDQDIADFGAALKNEGATLVLHQWDPSPAVAEAIKTAGVRLVVLDDAVGGKNGAVASAYLSVLRSDLDKLYTAMQ